MKRISLIYDDRRIPNSEVASINGAKSFGNTIYKRRKISDIVKASVYSSLSNQKIDKGLIDWHYLGSDSDESSVLKEIDDSAAFPVCVIFSDFIIGNESEFAILIKKAMYAHESYAVLVNGITAMTIFPDAKAYGSTERTTIDADAFSYIGEASSFISYITGGFDARFFNSLEGDYYTVTKQSSNIEKIKKEYTFYYLLPENMRHYFVQPFDYKENNGMASYSMERYHMTDVAIRFVHGAVLEDELKRILDQLFRFIDTRATKTVTVDEADRVRHELYLEKVSKRIEQFKATDCYKKIEKYIISGTEFKNIDDILGFYECVYSDITAGHKNDEQGVLVAGHGDLCFSNILYQDDAQVLRLIDPKGALGEEDIYTDPMYDIAKLSHSIMGMYDFFNTGLYDICVGNDMLLSLKLDGDNEAAGRLFCEKLEERGIDIRLVRLYEASLFLSMLPLHVDNERKVLAFMLNAINILKSL